MKNRVAQLGLILADDQIKYVTRRIKEMGDNGSLTLDDVHSLLYAAAERAETTHLNEPITRSLT